MTSGVLCLAMLFGLAGDDELIVNGGFEQGMAGWSSFWSRDGSGSAALDAQEKHAGRQAVRIEYPGAADWSVAQAKPLAVVPGQIYELAGQMRVSGESDATLCVILRDAKGQAIEWAFGAATAKPGDGWRAVSSRFLIPPRGTSIVPRVIGHGPAKLWADDISLKLRGSLDALRVKGLPEKLMVASNSLDVTLTTADGALEVVDNRTQRHWRQQAETPVVVLDAKAADGGLTVQLLDPAGMNKFTAAIVSEKDRPELALTLSGEGELGRPLGYPHPFVAEKGELLIMPVNEGISYPADDATLPEMHYILYGGHGLCMAWYGICGERPGAGRPQATAATASSSGGAGMMTLVETPDDAAVRVRRHDGLLQPAPQWDPQKGRFGPARKLRYVFFDDGGYVAMAKRYREYAKQVGLLKTLAEKRKENANVDRLVGAVNVWCWDRDPVAVCRELQAAGIARILWSRGGSAEQLKALNDLGVLTSRYDIYQDVMDPANFPKLRGVHGDWTTAAWPKDLMIDRNGQWIRGWGVQAKDGAWLYCGVTCDARAVDYARQRIPEELKTKPYLCRFIDTTTASPWRECYAPDHPVTRSESRQWKMRLLEYVSKDCGLVCGCETGHDASVPYLHYFEGMLSLGPYRVPDSGRKMQVILDDVPERVAKFQTGHFYRLPLWELVYHDCVVAQWYWGDYNNKLPKLWDRRDLFNALYGTPPMFMFNQKLWDENRARFTASYRVTCPVARATGYREMLSHAWLTADHAVQQSRFAGGVTVSVNFGDQPFTLPDGARLGPLQSRVEGLGGQE